MNKHTSDWELVKISTGWQVVERRKPTPMFNEADKSPSEPLDNDMVIYETGLSPKDLERAKLIAAAPELLEALTEMLSEFQNLTDVPSNYKELEGYDGGDNPRNVAVIKSLAAIKKATE